MSRPGDGIQFDADRDRARAVRPATLHGSITGRQLGGTTTVLRHGAAVHEKWAQAGEAKA